MLEVLYPILARQRKLVTFPIEGFWKDLGKPQDLLDGNKFYLQFLIEK